MMMMLEVKKKEQNEKWLYGVNNIISGSNSLFREKNFYSWNPMILGFTLFLSLSLSHGNPGQILFSNQR